MEELKRIYGLCPKCKNGYLIKETLFEGFIFSRRKVVHFICPCCGFRNKTIFKLNESSYQKEIE